MTVFINETEKVKKQYSKAKNLSSRISIHEKYSVNKMGLGNWYFTFYEIKEGARILELGCGTGAMWFEHKDVLEKCSKAVVISDFSEGMLQTAHENLGDIANVEYKVIDIQDIPYEDEYFDVVIANGMLYHVPDLEKALSEVNRVLKKGGILYDGKSIILAADPEIPIPGFLIITSKRHIQSFSELLEDERAEIGDTIAWAEKAIENIREYMRSKGISEKAW